MFFAVVLACGINVSSPAVLNSCAIISNRQPFISEEDCTAILPEVGAAPPAQNAPPGVYVADAKCVYLSDTA